MRRLPSNAKGLVTTATLNAPSSLASEATTGAAPLPVPPPRPEVMKIMSEPSSASMIFSVSSSAALRPTSGLAPAPSPLVSFAPSCNFHRRLRKLQRLQVGIGGDEFDAFDLGADHAIDGVAPAAAHADHFYFRRRSSSLKLMRIPDFFCVMLSPQPSP